MCSSFSGQSIGVDSTHEMWSLLEDQPMRFSLYEFEDVTGLNCNPFDTHEQWDVAHEDFWVEMNVPISEGPKLNELQAIFPLVRNWSREKRVMVGLLSLLSIGIFGISSNSRIPLHCAKRVMDPAAFQRYPWGRVGFTSLMDSIKVLVYEGKRSYTLHGCVHALVIWIYESVPGIGEMYGHRIEGADEVPLLSWYGSRQRINFSNFCAQEKKNHQKVRVRHMILKSMEDRYPKWDEVEPPTDLDNMIVDILNDQLDTKFWDVGPQTMCQKRKTHVTPPTVPDTVDESPSTKRKKEKCQAAETGDSHMPIDNTTIRRLLDIVENFTEKVETLDVSVAEKVSKTVEGAIQAQMEARMGVFETELRNKVAKLEEEINVLKGMGNAKIPSTVGNSKTQDSSNSMSWEVQTRKGSTDGLPVQRVIKKEKKNKNTTLPVKKEEVPLKKVKLEKPFVIPQLKDQSISTEDWANHLNWEKSNKCRNALDALASSLEEPTRRRKPTLTKTQVWPYVGSSTVKRIITGEAVSKEPYDPLSKVDPEKLQKVLDFIKSDLEEEESGFGDTSAGFYLKLMIPRDDWPTRDYGWLHDSHMAAAMLMFHRRSLQSQSPYLSSRIAFLDRWFVNFWVNDYKKFTPKTKELSENSRMYNLVFLLYDSDVFSCFKTIYEDLSSI